MIAEKIFKNMSDEEYFALKNHMSHSLLARYKEEGMNCLNELPKSSSLVFGSLVDTMLTNSEDISKFYVVRGLSDAEKDLLYQMIEDKKAKGSDLNDDDMIKVADEQSWRTNWKRDTRLTKLHEIYSQVTGHEVEHVIDIDTFMAASKCVSELKESKLTKYIFSGELETVYQGVLTGVYETLKNIDRLILPKKIAFRSKFDVVLIDETAKVILPYDLKTTSKPEHEFANSFVKFGYDLQARIYMTLLKDRLLELDMNDWTVLPFTFIVVNKDDPKPMLFSVELPEIGRGNVYTKRGDVLYDPIYLADRFLTDIECKSNNTKPIEWRDNKVFSLNKILNIKNRNNE